jgi:hypothetical protein
VKIIFFLGKTETLRVQPSTRVVPTTSMGVSQMSVKELVLCLNLCALPQLAKLCVENTIDGKFLFDLQEHDLLKYK